jgi:hypothetical protein
MTAIPIRIRPPPKVQLTPRELAPHQKTEWAREGVPFRPFLPPPSLFVVLSGAAQRARYALSGERPAYPTLLT